MIFFRQWEARLRGIETKVLSRSRGYFKFKAGSQAYFGIGLVTRFADYATLERLWYITLLKRIGIISENEIITS